MARKAAVFAGVWLVRPQPALCCRAAAVAADRGKKALLSAKSLYIFVK